MSNKTKILITGSNGLLGQNLVNLLVEQSDYEIFAFSKGKNKITKTTNFEYFNVNITNSENVVKHLRKIKPHFIINCAAMTDVDACELRIRECNEVNVNAVKTLIESCAIYKTHLIHISTDFIFDGTKGFYKEEDKPNPVNYYGQSKLNAEKLLQKSKIDFSILRTILVYGSVEDANRNNIVLWVKNTLENKQEIRAVNDQFRMPTLANDLAKACLLVIQNNLKQTTNNRPQIKQVYHVSSNKLLSIYEIAMQIATTFNLDKKLIRKITTLDLNQKAERPIKTGFILDKSIKELGLESASFKERLTFFKTLNNL
ncbi:MAG: SDR family oxidoreductase [Flavobacteriaceae bacterium]|nr:SDR family oxidoreductase [Flavobacteriaceae bacterium]